MHVQHEMYALRMFGVREKVVGNDVLDKYTKFETSKLITNLYKDAI